MKMIPKIIHYCWFGNKKLTSQAVNCIKSWRKYCPSYKIIQWDESNFDLKYNPYVCEASESGKWAFVTDVVRLYVLYNYGGIYMDSDVEVIKPLDDILQFNAVSGFQDESYIPTGIMASIKHHHFIKDLLDEYNGIHFRRNDGTFDLKTNCDRITSICLKKGLNLNNKFQVVDDLTLFPSDFFCAKNRITGRINITENTYTIHHFAGSWITDENKRNIRIYSFLIWIFGEDVAKLIYKTIKVIKNTSK